MPFLSCITSLAAQREACKKPGSRKKMEKGRGKGEGEGGKGENGLPLWRRSRLL